MKEIEFNPNQPDLQSWEKAHQEAQESQDTEQLPAQDERWHTRNKLSYYGIMSAVNASLVTSDIIALSGGIGEYYDAQAAHDWAPYGIALNGTAFIFFAASGIKYYRNNRRTARQQG